MTEQPTIHVQMAKVMRDVQSVRKGEVNTHFHFSFRGIDAVVNAVGPMLREHGVIVVPHDMQAEYEQVPGKSSMNVRVRNVYRFYGPAGDFVETVATGESIDGQDKGTAKANSVAFRTCLLQALCLPTDEPDPDSFSPERAVEIRDAARNRAHDDIARRLTEATTVEALRGLWQEANKAGFDDLKQQIEQRTETVKADGAST